MTISDMIYSDKEDAKIYRLIFDFCLEKGNKSSFRTDELVLWLLKKYRPFVEEFEDNNARTNMANRVHSKRDFVKKGLKYLMQYGFLDYSTVTSRRNSSIPTKEFHIGDFENYCLNLYRLTKKCNNFKVTKIKSEICEYLIDKNKKLAPTIHDTHYDFIMKVLNRSIETDSNIVIESANLFFSKDYHLSFSKNLFDRAKLRKKLNVMLYKECENTAISNISSELIEKDTAEKDLVAFQFKLDIENDIEVHLTYNSYFLHEDNYPRFDFDKLRNTWERTRYENINNPYEICETARCNICKGWTIVGMVPLFKSREEIKIKRRICEHD